MEKLLHYTWRHKMLPLGTLHTTDGREVEVIDAGMYNRSNSGPDFFNAKLKIDGMMWVGSVELHIKASDWYRHHHDTDAAYNNVVLHVVTEADMEVTTTQNVQLATLVIPIPEHLKDDYANLLGSDIYPPCYKIIPSLPSLKVRGWMAALQTERLEMKTKAMAAHLQRCNGAWEDAYFAMLAHSFGFGINGEAFDEWAHCIPLRSVDHHRDDLFQVESIFIGQAGLLEKVDERYAKEYAYLQKKFGLTPMNNNDVMWKYLRTRPHNFPHVRILQLAKMYHERRTNLSALLECKDVSDIGRLYDMKGSKLNLLIINTAIPVLFAYGRHHSKEYLCERAFDIQESLKAEDNHITRMWKECGLEIKSAGDSQALIQLKKEYCDRKECLRCRFGHEFLSGEYRQGFLHSDI